MANSALFQYTLPAERARGAVFSQRFESALSMARDGWTLYNSPTFRPHRKGGGIELNGTNQYATRPLNGELNSDELTFHIEFTPGFLLADGAFHGLLDTPTTGSRFYVYKDNLNEIRIGTGGATILNLPYAAISPYWVDGGRNLLSFYGGGGALAADLNGHEVAAAAGVVTPCTEALLYFGRTLGGSLAGGTYSRLYVGQHTSDLAEHTAYYNQTMWDWRNKLAYDFPFGTAQYDPTNKRTLDSRDSSLYATLGDGAGTGEPTQGPGYLTFDGVDDYLSGISDPTGSFTVLGYKDTGTGWEFFSDNDLTNWTPIFTSGGFTGKLGHLGVATSVLNATQLLDAEYRLRPSGSEI